MVSNKSEIFLKLKQASNLDEAFTMLEDIIASRGLGKYFFTCMNTQDSPTIFKVDHYRTTYPDEWQTAYFEKRYFYDDPIAKRVMMNQTPFYWSEYLSTLNNEPTQSEQLMFAHAQEFGIIDGIGFSYLRDTNNLYTLTVSSPRAFKEYDQAMLAEFYLLGSYLVDLYESQAKEGREYVSLSDKEKAVVSLGAIGKTDAEIAIVQGVSVNTVRYYWKSIFKKLDSYSRVFAIIRAINLGFVDTDIYNVTTNSGSVQTYIRTV